jgi:O-antigen ligase
VYVGWLVVVCLIQDNPLHSLNNMREEWLFIIVAIGVYLFRDKKTLERAIGVLAVGLGLIAVGSILMYLFRVQYHFGDGFAPLPPANPRVSGAFVEPLTYGNIFAMASLAVVGWSIMQRDRWNSRTWALLGAGALGLVSILFCGGRGPVLAAFFGLIVLILVLSRAGRRWGWIVLLVVAVVGVATPSVRSRFSTELLYHFNSEWPGGRLFIWERSLEIVADNPLTGIGPGNFDQEYIRRLDPSITSRFYYQHAHNDFLEAAARSGIPGLATFVMLWGAVLFSMGRAWQAAAGDPERRRRLAIGLVGSVVFLAASMTEATFSDEEVRAVLMLVWAIGLSAVYKTAEVSGSGIDVTR